MPSAAENARTIGHHDHGLNSPSSGSPSSMSDGQDVLGQLAALSVVHAPDVERDQRAHESCEQQRDGADPLDGPLTTGAVGCARMLHVV